jgi:hypothetical protein
MDMKRQRTREREVRDYALHLALIARKRGGVFVPSKRCGNKRKIGAYRSVGSLERAIRRFGDSGEDPPAS